MAYVVIPPTDTDYKSPIDQKLMDTIRENLDDLNARVSAAAGSAYRFVVNGLFEDYDFDDDLVEARELDGAVVSKSSTQLSRARLYMRDPGASGTLEADVIRWKSLERAIIEIDHQFTQPTQSIARIAPALATQSIARATPQVATQSITYFETQRNVQSITALSGGKARIDLDGGAFSAKFVVGQFVLIASATNPLNDGTFEILELNRDGADNLIIQNSSAVDQTAAAGTLDLQCFSYNLINPASSEFSAGEKALFASHTNPVNDGTFEIVSTNDGGNNIVIYNEVGVTQGGVAGTIDVLRWTYTFLAAAGADFIVGEAIFGSSHTSSANDGNHTITAVNSGGNNIIVYNELGVAQGAPAGTVDTNRFQYNLLVDVSSNINVNETITAVGHDNGANDFDSIEVVQINRLAANNLVVYNPNGVAQAGVNGNVRHTRKLVKFDTDYSADFTVNDSIADIEDVNLNLYNERYTVLEINRGGGANFNIVIDVPDQDAVAIQTPNGNVAQEGQSVFSTKPSLTTDQRKQSASNAVLRNPFVLDAEDILTFDLTEIPVDGINKLAGNIHLELE